MARSPEGKLRSQSEKKGYAIWNLVRSNRDLIREYSFWEIREGDKANLWNEAWQQRGKLRQQPKIQEIYQFTTQMEEDVAWNYWLPEREGYWRKWKTQEDWQGAPETEQWANYKNDMETRKIAVKEGTYIIRWGK